jgi:D-aminoacyl-tRNA deacylase
MRLLIQRVLHASVVVEQNNIASIGRGLLVLVGIETDDKPEDLEWLAGKLVQMRLFNDEAGVMNLSVLDLGLECLLVSQFTLMASTKKGNRPSYIRAARPELAEPLFEHFCKLVAEKMIKPIQKGQFGADMKVSLINDGPVTIWLDSKNRE